jgi:Holliday junction resolvase-like predicted endonuclease
MNQFHVSVAAEAFAAAVFAQAEFDVSVQYGANQPEYDLMISKGDLMAKVSVKGSQDGGWGLTQSLKKSRTYHEAAEFWGKSHRAKTIYCFVQFYDVQIGQMPRIYLATVPEIVNALKSLRGGEGYTSLAENYTYRKGKLKGVNDKLPDSWLFCSERAEELVRSVSE